jgi:PPOX class probable FMN-dependent enzyme
MDLHSCIDDIDALQSLFRSPSQRALDKEIDHIDDAAARMIAASPLFILATSNGERVDISPRGGAPGFVRVIDEYHIAFGDLAGNNRIDSYRNLLHHASVAMLFMIPGLEETMRVNGSASVSTDLDVRAMCTDGERVPNLAIVVSVKTCFMHCGKAMRRSNIWDNSTWPTDSERPSGAELLASHLGVNDDVDAVASSLEEGYRATLWQPGGAG